MVDMMTTMMMDIMFMIFMMMKTLHNLIMPSPLPSGDLMIHEDG